MDSPWWPKSTKRFIKAVTAYRPKSHIASSYGAKVTEPHYRRHFVFVDSHASGGMDPWLFGTLPLITSGWLSFALRGF